MPNVQKKETEMVCFPWDLYESAIDHLKPIDVFHSTGEKPICGPCLKSSLKCVYDDPSLPEVRIKTLEDKLTQLESVLAHTNTNQSGFSRSIHLIGRQNSPRVSPYPAASHAQLDLLSERSYPDRQARPDDQTAFSLAFKELWEMSDVSQQAGLRFFDDDSLIRQSSRQHRFPRSDDTEQLPAEACDTLVEDQHLAGLSLKPWELDRALLSDGRARQSPMQASNSEVDRAEALRSGHPSSTHQAPNHPAPDYPCNLSCPDTFPQSWSTLASSDNRVAVLKAYVLDREELPKEIRDPLLRLYFARKESFGIFIHDERFWSALDSESIKDRPHSSLLFALYFCAKQFSTDEAVWALEDIFFGIAKSRLDQAIAEDDHRTIDLIRAATLLSSGLYARAQVKQAWIFGGLAMRLCSFYNLQTVSLPIDPSSAEDSSGSKRETNRKISRYQHPPAEGFRDLIDQAMESWAFWTAWIVDICGSIGTGFTPAMHWSEIHRPLPLPMNKYSNIESYTVSPQTTVFDVFDQSQEIIVGDLTESYSIISSLLLSEASRLPDKLARASICQGPHDSHRSSSSNQPPSLPLKASLGESTNPGFTDDPLTLIPVEILEVQGALVRFIKSLPIDRIDPGRKTPGGIPSWRSDGLPHDSLGPNDHPNVLSDPWGVDRNTIELHTEIHTALALVYRERSVYDRSAWAQAVWSARSVVKILHIIVDVDFGQLGFFILVCWRIVACILLEDVKRQRANGQEDEALSITVDIELIVLAMERIGTVHKLGHNMRTAAVREMGA